MLGQVLIPLCMFMLISKLCGYTYKKWVIGVLIGAAVIMFAIVKGMNLEEGATAMDRNKQIGGHKA